MKKEINFFFFFFLPFHFFTHRADFYNQKKSNRRLPALCQQISYGGKADQSKNAKTEQNYAQ